MDTKYKEGDKLILHSVDGNDYEIEIVNVNPYRPPDMIYAVDIYIDGHLQNDDFVFVPEEVLDEFEKVGEEDGKKDS